MNGPPKRDAGERLAGWLYTAMLFLLLPYVAFHLLWRARRQPEYLCHWGERFGRYHRELPPRPVIWLHAVSVGETRAAAPLVKALRARYPEHQILLTHMTPTGRETGEQLFGENVLRCYLPYDYPFAVRRFLDHFKPDLGVLLETEIWPNLIHGCRVANVPLYLVNARLSEKSARRYARFGKLTAASLRMMSAIAAQTGDDAMRLEALGASNVSVMGNLKFDIVPSPEFLELGSRLRRNFGVERPIFLAASTREGEEEKILAAVLAVGVPGLLTVIVPRHPQRFDAVAQLMEKMGINYQRRSLDRPVGMDTAVLLGDSMGEMFAYYAACDVALIGGSLLPYGGQNLIEACAVGKPVILGPHTYNFSEAAEQAVAAGAAVRVENEEALVRELQGLLYNPERCNGMGQAGLEFSLRHQGATEKVMDLLERAGLPSHPSPDKGGAGGVTSATD
ncbi:MAG: lipid IV(A) 3-deoxy-D-manno-octulosonic acid transferase [Sulfurimicrobium sp.]|nr:lipid IV(A) 3-deoxy-D-manno-octulosonic acid transferase [Sulfurimicrobium sp.]MDO9190681.1 lipid IV(A) 3-deoxy-D-manno-octulosonic acid transferase [Sulfurimicrobium sp.]MDP1705710.1 lipid IV(A) 3-deoxy-D-manno-octulosonic acid transferase [Sulfurimicrobium sp.]MDP2199126.1 lipid IV(A) 3-deoxy-D-manno-octulosonic acid transferase [Sulfurimicrobium sp.]MDP3686703.1 lipid IV(A) 3-deoxy-D-manno-octulosonic acid transferase [Sulfurimicrobium sp.]